MPNKVYIKVTEEMVGDPNIIATLEKEGGFNAGDFDAEEGSILYINKNGYINSISNDMESALLRDGYSVIQPDEYAHTIHLHKGDTSLLIPLRVPEGYEAVMNGEVVTEIELELRKKRWKPEMGDEYFSVCLDPDESNPYSVRHLVWEDKVSDRYNFDRHNVFLSLREAMGFLKILNSHWHPAVEEYEKSI